MRIDVPVQVLVVNCGSATVRIDLFDVDGTDPRRSASQVMETHVASSAGSGVSAQSGSSSGNVLVVDLVEGAVTTMVGDGPLDRPRLGVVGHRVVHGGAHFTKGRMS